MANELNDVFEGANIDAIRHTKDKTSVLDRRFKEINKDIKNGDYEVAAKKAKAVREEARTYLNKLDEIQDDSTFDSSVISMLMDIVPLSIPGVGWVHLYNVLKGYNGRLKHVNGENRIRNVEMKDLNAIVNRCRARMERYVAKADKIYNKVQSLLAENNENVKKESAYISDVDEKMINEYTCDFDSDLDSMIKEIKDAINGESYSDAKNLIKKAKNQCTKALDSIEKAGKKDRQKILKCFKVLNKLERKVDGKMTKESMEIFDTTNFAYVGEAYDLSDDSDDVDDKTDDIINNDDISSFDDEDEASSSEKIDEVLDDVDDTSDEDEESVSTTCGAMLPQGMGYGLNEGNDDIMSTLGTDESDFSATDGYKIDNVDDFLGDGDDEFKVNKEILHLENDDASNSNNSNNSNGNSSDSDSDDDDYVDVDASEAVDYVDPYDVVTEAFGNLKDDIKAGIDKANNIIRGKGRIDTVREELVREVLDTYQKIKENQIRLKVMKIKFPKARKSSDYRKIQEDNITLEKKYRAIYKTANRNEKTYINKTRQAIDASTKAEFHKQIENAKKFRKANRKPLFSRESVDYDVDGLSPLDFGFSVDEAANIDPDIKDDIKKLNDLGYATKYSSSGHHKLRKKEDINRDGVYYGKLYTDARLMFSGNYNFPSAPKYWEFKSVDGNDYLDVPPITYNPKDGTPDEAFSKWKKSYMQSLETWIDSLRTRSGSDKNIVDKDGNTMGESVDEFFEETLTDILIDTL